MPRGRPRKDKTSEKKCLEMLEPDLAEQYKAALSKKKQKRSQRLNAIFIDTVYAVDPDTGYKVEVNVYRVQPKKQKRAFDDDDFTEGLYVGFDSSFMDELERDIVPTPLGSADLVESVDDEEDDSDFGDNI